MSLGLDWDWSRGGPGGIGVGDLGGVSVGGRVGHFWNSL